MRNKSIIAIIVFSLLFFTIGCSRNKENTVKIINKDIKVIEFQSGVSIKRIDKGNEINTILTYINSLKLKEFVLRNNKNTNRSENKYKINIYDNKNEVIDHLSIKNNIVYYRGKMYKINTKNLNTLLSIISEFKYSQKVDKNLTIIDAKIKKRKNFPIKHAIKGYWVDYYGSKMYFDDRALIIGKNKFKYIIKSNSRNSLHLVVYGLDSIFTKDNYLFDLYIKMDDSKCNMKVEKIMKPYFGVKVNYNYNMIYIVKSNNNFDYLGEFDSEFFYFR